VGAVVGIVAGTVVGIVAGLIVPVRVAGWVVNDGVAAIRAQELAVAAASKTPENPSKRWNNRSCMKSYLRTDHFFSAGSALESTSPGCC
jgi:hypothetical protein